jgi:hypothetical protein
VEELRLPVGEVGGRDGGGGHPGLRQPIGRLLGPTPGRPTGDGGVDAIVLRPPPGDGVEAGLGHEPGGPDRRRQGPPLVVVGDGDGQPAVVPRARVDALRCRQRVAAPVPGEDRPRPGELHHLLGGDVERAVEEGDLDELALARCLPVLQGGEEGEDGVHPAHGVARSPGHQGQVVVPGDPRQARCLLDGHGEAGTVAPRAVEPEGGHADEHDRRVAGVNLVPGDPEPLQHPGGEVLDHDVGAGDQAPEERAALRGVEVEGQVALAGVGPGEHHGPLPRPFAGETAEEADPVRVGGRLDLDDVGAEGTQVEGGEGTGPEGRQVDDADPVEGSGAGARPWERGRRRTVEPVGTGLPRRRPRGSGRERSQRGAPEAVRRAGTGPAVGAGHVGAPGDDLVEPGDGRAGADRRDGDPEVGGQLDHLAHRAGGGHGGDGGGQLLPAGHPLVGRPEGGVFAQVGALDQHAEVRPLLGGHRAEADAAVGGRLDRRDLDRPPRCERREPLGGDGGVRAVEAQGGGLQHRHVHVLPLPRPPGVDPGGDGAHGGEHAGHPLDDVAAGRHRGPVGQPAPRRAPARGLDGHVGGGPVGPRPRRPPRADRDDGERGRGAEQRVGADASPVAATGPVGGEDHVGIGRPPGDRPGIVGVAGVGRDRPHSRPEEAEQGSVLAGEERGWGGDPPAQGVARRRLDEQAVRSQVDEELGGVGAGDGPCHRRAARAVACRQVQDAEAGERRTDGARWALRARHGGSP